MILIPCFFLPFSLLGFFFVAFSFGFVAPFCPSSSVVVWLSVLCCYVVASLLVVCLFCLVVGSAVCFACRAGASAPAGPPARLLSPCVLFVWFFLFSFLAFVWLFVAFAGHSGTSEPRPSQHSLSRGGGRGFSGRWAEVLFFCVFLFLCGCFVCSLLFSVCFCLCPSPPPSP